MPDNRSVVIYNPSEFSQGYSQLFALRVLFPEVVCWAPTSGQFYAEIGNEIPIQDFAYMFRDNIVISAARDEWADPTWRRLHPWTLAQTWTRGFDDEVAKCAIRVGSEGGTSVARELVEGDRWPANQSGRTAKTLTELVTCAFRRQNLPVGIMEKARRAPLLGIAPEVQIIRDLYNIFEAARLVGANTIVVSHPEMHRLLSCLVERLSYSKIPIKAKPTVPQKVVHEMFNLLVAVAPLVRNLRSSKSSLNNLQRELQCLITEHGGAVIASHLDHYTKNINSVRNLCTHTLEQLGLDVLLLLTCGLAAYDIVTFAIRAPWLIYKLHKVRRLFHAKHILRPLILRLEQHYGDHTHQILVTSNQRLREQQNFMGLHSLS